MSLTGLRDLLSLDMTSTLVASGYACAWLVPGSASSSSSTTLTVTNASNTTPIVVTTSTPHGIVAAQPAHVVIAGVVGNTAANNLDSVDVVNRAWVAVVQTSTTFALYSVNVSTGALEASVGNAAYVSGGTVRKAFTDGRVLLGSQHASYEQSSPPRVVLIPRSSDFNGKAVYNRSNVSGFPSAEFARQVQQRSLRNDNVTFEVHCWGASTPPDPDLDFNITQVLYQQVIRSTHALGWGSYDLGNGTWIDQTPGESQLIRVGHVFSFGLVIQTPVLGILYPYAPADVAPTVTTNLTPPDGGASGVGCTNA